MSRDWRHLRLLVIPANGVITDGGVWCDARGENLRRFHDADALALRSLTTAGVACVALTAVESPIISGWCRAAGAQVEALRDDPLESLLTVSRAANVSLEAVGYIAATLADVPCLRAVGFPLAMVDAPEAALELAMHVLPASAGMGGLQSLSRLRLPAEPLGEDDAVVCVVPGSSNGVGNEALPTRSTPIASPPRDDAYPTVPSLTQLPDVDATTMTPSQREDLLIAWGKEFALPVFDLFGKWAASAQKDVVRLLPAKTCERLGVLPLLRDGERIYVAMKDARDLRVLMEVSRLLSAEALPLLVHPDDLRWALQQVFGAEA